MFLLLISFVTATTLYGTVYSFDLEKRTNAIVTVNTVPPQTKVAKDGTYSFDLPFGEYTITASYSENNELKESVSENIQIQEQGSFILDLILFPSFEEEEELLQEAEEDIAEHEYFKETNYLQIIIVIILVIIIYFIIKYRKTIKKIVETTEKPKVSDLADEVTSFIKKQSGRTTQKDIRKQFPLSEAKISLVISELEEKNIVKRIKKGRGNIIVLN